MPCQKKQALKEKVKRERILNVKDRTIIPYTSVFTSAKLTTILF